MVVFGIMDDVAVLRKKGYIVGINFGKGFYVKVKFVYSERFKFNVAVKIFDRKKTFIDFVERFFFREMDILVIVNYRFIIKIYEIFEILDGRIYIVMEFGV